MKNFQANLLVVLALALCGLCAWQWREQTLQRDEITALNGMVYQKSAEIQNDTNALANLSRQVEQMDARITEIKAAAATNAQLVEEQKRQISQLGFRNLKLTNAVTQYTQAVAALSEKLRAAYAGMEQQNVALTNLVAQREVLVKKFNEAVNERNDVVAKYNALVKPAAPPPAEAK